MRHFGKLALATAAVAGALTLGAGIASAADVTATETNTTGTVPSDTQSVNAGPNTGGVDGSGEVAEAASFEVAEAGAEAGAEASFDIHE
ncbi:hypothetical protein [Nocardia terpenica]|uniref:Uncharacterized protein n=1 Tax=Nocardia terpenica TaxID=455432 RepID=A0A6G9ZF47_9NOCA|nr:hypothetical protein [Nocardia terpenica]QIS23613.1 hypothetical protein F6W96_40455 [Nocardia terpenica]